MDFTLYVVVKSVVTAVILFMSVQLIVGPMPKILRRTPYHVSRRIMGWALSVMPVVFTVYYIVGKDRIGADYAPAINFCSFYTTISLMHIALLALIGEKLSFRSKYFILYIVGFFVVPITLYYVFVHLRYSEDSISYNTLLFSSVAAQLTYFHQKMLSAKNNSKSLFVREVYLHIQWMRRLKFLFLGLVVSAFVTPLFGDFSIWHEMFYMLYLFFVFIFIYEGYRRFIVSFQSAHIEADEESSSDNSEDLSEKIISNSVLSVEQYHLIEKQMVDWVNEKKFCHRGLTIESVSVSLGTNRTYLSAYINSTYSCSFKAWVTKLRVEEAKVLLRDDKKHTISEIAEAVGFSSQASFTHVFRNSTGFPPARWCAEQRVETES